MARTRDLRPGFFKNENLGECQPLARLLFAGLWVHADREGRLEDRPKRLRLEILPYDNCDLNELLSELEHFKFIQRYEVGGLQFIQIYNFSKNQRIHPKEPPSVMPPPEHIQNRDLPRLAATNCSIPTIPTIPTKSPLPPKGESEWFEKFYKPYPKKGNKAKAQTIWREKNLDAIAQAVIDALLRFQNSPQWQEHNGRYIPTAAKFLTDERWKDAAVTPKKSKAQQILEAEQVEITVDGGWILAPGVELSPIPNNKGWFRFRDKDIHQSQISIVQPEREEGRSDELP